MKIAGGCYWESCESPRWRRLLGSGGRAAVALSKLVPKLELHTAFPPDHLHELHESLGAELNVVAHFAPLRFAFAYFHPLSTPAVYPSRPSAVGSFTVSGDLVLRFGMLESEAVVTAETAIFDPQQANSNTFRSNGSTARNLLLVMNSDEALALAGASDRSTAAKRLLASDGAVALVMKCGTEGAHVYEGNLAPVFVPAFRSSRVFKIGSGDIFSAAIAYYWGMLRQPLPLAARLASQSVASYCEDPVTPLLDLTSQPQRNWSEVSATTEEIAVIGSVDTIAQRWLMQEAEWHLTKLGGRVRRVEVISGSMQAIAKPTGPTLLLLDGFRATDQSGLEHLLDGSRICVLTERTSEFELPSTARVTGDFATAMYYALWN